MPEFFKPNLPTWFEQEHKTDYAKVFRDELEEISQNPEEHFKNSNFRIGGEERTISWQEADSKYNLSEKIKEMAESSKEWTLENFSFQETTGQINELFESSEEKLETIDEDFQEVLKSMAGKIHFSVLHKMVENYIPQREAILHRGSFTELKEDSKMPKKLVENMEKGPFGLLLKFALKDPTFKIETIRENLEKGIGGFEFDIQANENGDPVVTHSKKETENAPPLEDFLKMIKELLPQDSNENIRARRGLKLLMHMKIGSGDQYKELPEKIVRQLDEYNLTHSTYIQSGRPETFYAFDQAEQKLNAENPNRSSNVNFVFQCVPLAEIANAYKENGKKGMGTVFEKMGNLLEKLRLANRQKEGRLSSITTNWADEMAIFNDIPADNDFFAMLKKHNGRLAISSAAYNKLKNNENFRNQIKDLELNLHIGSTDDKEMARKILEDKEKPKSFVALNRDVVYPEKK